MGADLVEMQRGFAANAADTERAVTEAVAGRRSRGGTMVALSSPGARSVVLAQVRRDGFDEVAVVGTPDVAVCTALGFTLHGFGDWVKTSPHDADVWPGDAAVAAAALATDIDLTRVGIAWCDGLHDGHDVVRARRVLLGYFGAGRQRFTLPPKIDQERLLSYDRDGRLARAVIAISRPSRLELTSLRHLEECGIRTAADFVGAQVDYLSVRRTAYVIRRDGTPLQIRGIGADRALGLSAWRQWIDAGRAPVFG
ncbi:hypothetical protein [Actinoplanes friuliensis]|uniref:Uncharacterized protein n=1 Tax=Actinoplanes friuliensis DSM 7358 TaxID=1246995 RepID=U5VZY9_9ACTN|nr:hypothetical protein [Actinoplanes friuliensis]AGZ41290.1 hypothetical protein AFR_15040 [Actinoplanes friuliensis DSM 7358]